jgi:hypothetical protein
MRKATAYVATTRADSKLPAGTYRLVTEEEEIPALSFVAFRRTATLRPWHRAGFRCLCIPFKPSGHILVKAPRSVSDDTSRLRERRG